MTSLADIYVIYAEFIKQQMITNEELREPMAIKTFYRYMGAYIDGASVGGVTMKQSWLVMRKEKS